METPSPRSAATGLLLAGGQSRRMGGAFASGSGDKGLLDLGGKPMIEHVIERLRPQVGQMVINANGETARFAPFGLAVVADPIEGFVGPLAGILAGLRWSAAHAPRSSHVVSVSTDAPFLPADLVRRLQAGIEGTACRIALARSGGEVHPVIGLWPVDLADDLEAALGSGTRKVLDWTDRHGWTGIDFPQAAIHDRLVDPFFNANTPEELAEARQLLSR
jgi:molybdopterin-guanine dinucleotide biosynthesis protein A